MRSFIRTVRQSLLAREVGGLWVGEGVALAMGLLQAVVVARILGPRDFGTAALILGSTTLVFGLLDPKAREAVVRYLGAHHATGRIEQALAVPKVAYGADLLLGVAGFAIIAGGASWIEDHVIHSRGATHLLVVFAATSMFTAPSATSRAVLTTFRRFPAVAMLQAGSSLLRIALMVILVAADFGVSGVVYATGISIVVESLCAGFLAHRAVRGALGRSWWQARRAALGGQFGEIVRFMAYTDLTSLVAVFVKEADLVVLGVVAGPTQAGYYRLARSVAAPMSSLVLPLQQVVYPRLAAMAGTGDHRGMQQAARRYMLKVGSPIGAAALLFVPLLPFLVPAVAGPEYRPAVSAAAVLFAGTALTLPAFWTRPVLLAGGHVRFLLAVSIVASTLTLAGYFVLGELFGGAGVALSRVVFAGIGGSAAAVFYFFRVREPGDGSQPRRPESSSIVVAE